MPNNDCLTKWAIIKDSVDDFMALFQEELTPCFKTSELIVMDAVKPDDYYPFTNLQGVYCVFDTIGNLAYIGKASGRNAIGHRLHVCLKPFWDKTEWPNKWKASPPAYYGTIGLHNNDDGKSSWAAAGLEEYLIKKLQPYHNKNLR